MRLYLFATILLVILLAEGVQAQTIEGVVFNEKEETVAYVNIGVAGTAFGTISREDGSFKLRNLDQYKEQNLMFSAIGYESKVIPVSSLLNQAGEIRIVLKEHVYVGEEILVQASRISVKTIGPKKRPSDGYSIILNSTGGSAMGLLFNLEERPFRINRASIYVIAPQEMEAQLRVRFYEVGEDGLPGEEFTPVNILDKQTIKDGRFWVDLTPYDIRYNRSFYLVFEWVHSDEVLDAFERQLEQGITSLDFERLLSISFRTGANRSGFSSIVRHGSQGKWQRVDLMPLISVELTY